VQRRIGLDGQAAFRTPPTSGRKNEASLGHRPCHGPATHFHALPMGIEDALIVAAGAAIVGLAMRSKGHADRDRGLPER